MIKNNPAEYVTVGMVQDRNRKEYLESRSAMTSTTLEAAKDYPQDIVKAADDVCRAMGIASNPTNCLPVLDALMAEREHSQWQPIETAPTDGKPVDLWHCFFKERIAEAQFRNGSWVHWSFGDFDTMTWVNVKNQHSLTHWMPIPESPKGGDYHG